MVNSACLGHFYFETECSVYNFNELQAESFKLQLFLFLA